MTRFGFRFYDRQGRPVSEAQAVELLARADDDYRRVALTEVGPWEVSTVWLGYDLRIFGPGPPLIFETMVFAAPERADHDLVGACWRWPTEAAALGGHDRTVALVRDVEAGRLAP